MEPLKRAVLALALAACTKSPSGPKHPKCLRVDSGFGPRGSVAVRAEVVVTGLEVPWSLVFLPDGSWLVTERPGRIRLIRDGRLLAPVANVPVHPSGEGGLLGAALHPAFAENRLFYLYYTAEKDGGAKNRVERWRLSEDGTKAERERLILDDIPAAKFHDGGRLRFGPDGKLYVATGDARDPDLSQSKASLAGKLLRLEPDGSIPADNPIKGSPIFVLGVRNLQGFDWLDDRTLALVDHGPSGELGREGNDEVSVAAAGDNLGWPTIWGCERKPGLVSPVLSFREAVPPGGAAIYRGGAIAEWQGNLLVGTLGSKHLHRVAFAKDRSVTSHEVYFEGEPPSGFGRLRDVVMGPDGHLYVTTSNCDGRGACPPDKDRILRILRAGEDRPKSD